MTTAAKLQAISDATKGDLYDVNFVNYNGEKGDWMVEAVETHETIEQFIESSQNWNERSAMKRGTVGGCPFVVWKNIQVRKGAARRSMAVIDLGDVRFAVDAGLGDFIA